MSIKCWGAGNCKPEVLTRQQLLQRRVRWRQVAAPAAATAEAIFVAKLPAPQWPAVDGIDIADADLCAL